MTVQRLRETLNDDVTDLASYILSTSSPDVDLIRAWCDEKARIHNMSWTNFARRVVRRLESKPEHLMKSRAAQDLICVLKEQYGVNAPRMRLVS